MKYGKKLITGGQRPRVGSVSHQQQSQGAEVQVSVILRGQKAPVEISRFADGDTGSVLGDHLHPGGRVDLHQSVRDEYDVHPIEDTGQDAVPESRISLEVEDADHDLALGVVAGEGEGPGVSQHGRPGDADSQYTPVLSREKHNWKS